MPSTRLGALLLAMASVLFPAAAFGCSAWRVCNDFVLPRPGASGVPLNTGIAISGSDPFSSLELLEGASVVWQGSPDGVFPDQRAPCLRSAPLSIELKPNTLYVLKGVNSFGTQELTRFTTGNSEQPTAGTPPVITALRLYIVHIPDGSGCKACDTNDFQEVDYEPATFPGVPADSVIYTWSIRREGTTTLDDLPPRATHWAGGTTYGCTQFPYGCGYLPCAHRSAAFSYCATLTAWGLPYSPDAGVKSAEFCAKPIHVTLSGHPWDAGPGPAPVPDGGGLAADAALAQLDGGGFAAEESASCASAPGAGLTSGLLLLIIAVALSLRRS